MLDWLRRLRIITIGDVGHWHGRSGYPRDAHGIALPLYPTGDDPEASRSQTVAPYEANLVAQSTQKQSAAARAPLARLASLRPDLNHRDREIAAIEQEIGEVRMQRAAHGAEKFRPALYPLIFWAIIAALVYFEVSLNKAALDHLNIDEQLALESAIFISGVSFAAAKSTALVLRQRRWKADVWTDIAIAAVLNIVFLSALAFVGRLRAADAGGSADAAFFWLTLSGGYFAILLTSFLQIDPNRSRVQLEIALERMEGKLEQLQRERLAAAKEHNRIVADVRIMLAEVAGDLKERVAQYRNGVLRARPDDPPPSYFAHQVSAAALEPIHLGDLVDEHPAMHPATAISRRDGTGPSADTASRNDEPSRPTLTSMSFDNDIHTPGAIKEIAR
jgi:hypothetical protein